MTVPNETTEAPRPAAVYRLYDAEGALLYIGSSSNPKRRYRDHSRTSWWPCVARREEEWYPSRAAAYKAEDALIKSVSPKFNSVGTPSHAVRCRAAYADWRVRTGYAMRDGKPLNEPAGELAAEMHRAMAEQRQIEAGQRGAKNRPVKKPAAEE